jgi:hypothetical protein
VADKNVVFKSRQAVVLLKMARQWGMWFPALAPKIRRSGRKNGHGAMVLN